MTHPKWTPAYVGLGSNLDDPQSQVKRGVEALAELPHSRLIACSKLYRSAPFGPQDQPHYVNAAVGLLTQLDAHELLTRLKALEKKLGREQPALRWGPRIIDFDLLVFGNERIATDSLQVPHPGVAERSFVLQPLVDIAPELDVPGVGRASVLAKRLLRTGVPVAVAI